MAEIGRNDPCPCGSGEKYKRCCLLKKSSSPTQKMLWRIKQFRPNWFNLITFLLIVVLASGAYYNSFSVPFVFDDGSNIVHNRGVHLSSLRMEDGDLVRLSSSISKNGRAISQLSYAINYYFGELNVFGYHLMNLIIHILCAWTIFKFTLMTLTLPSMRDQYGSWAKEIAAACALIFTVHPINTQAVTYIVQRATSLAALFSLLCIICYAKGRLSEGLSRWQYYLVAFICFLIAFSSKQNTVVLPILVFLYEFFFFQKVDLNWLKKKWPYISGIVLVLFLILLIYTKFNPIGWFEEHYQHRNFTLVQRVMTEWRVIVYYFTLLFLPLPSRLNLDYDFPLSFSLINPPSTILSLFFILGLLAVAVYIAKKQPLISFFIIWFFTNLVVESTIIALDLVYEHRLYLPGIGMFIIVVWGMERAIHHLVPRMRNPLKIGLLAVLCITFSVMTYQRNIVWQSVVSVLEDVVKKAPNNARQHVNLGVAYSDLGMLDKALEQYLVGIKLDPNYPEAYNNLGNAYNRKGIYDKAVNEYLQAIRMRPDYKEAHNNLGSAYCNMRQYDKAIEEHLTALKINPECEKSHNNLGVAYSFKGMYDKAITEYQRSLEIDPTFTKARSNLGLAYSFKGMYDEAIEEFKKVLRINPNDAATNYNLGNIYNEQGKYDLAVKAFSNVVALTPNHAEAHNNLGLAYKNLRDFPKAEQEFKTAIQLRPDIAEFYFNLGLVYKESNRYAEAEKAFQQALQFKPGLAVVHYNLGILAEIQGQYELAFDRYQKTLQVNPNFALAYTNLGLLYLNKKSDPQLAIKMLKQSLTLYPDQPNAARLKDLVAQLEMRTAS
jgi:tetratricopeptide (TPR) repeat protein